MQLKEVDISSNSKFKIQGAINRDIPLLNKLKFQSLFLKDKLWSQIPNFDSWVSEFTRLNNFARNLNGK